MRFINRLTAGKPPQRLKRRLVWDRLGVRLMALVSLVMIQASGTMLCTYLDQCQQGVNRVQANALRLTRLASADHARVIEGAHQLLAALAHFSAGLNCDTAQCSALMGQLLEAQPIYANLGGVAADGQWLCNAKPLSPPSLSPMKAWFQQAWQSGGFAVSDYQVSKVGTWAGQAIVNFAYPVFTNTGQVTALAVATLDLDWLLYGPLSPGSEAVEVGWGDGPFGSGTEMSPGRISELR
jgi:hypothetical protein